jgi:hypothetical protein
VTPCAGATPTNSNSSNEPVSEEVGPLAGVAHSGEVSPMILMCLKVSRGEAIAPYRDLFDPNVNRAHDA